ncbi:MAG: leucine-rich repeat domain-containing protein, partial [Clostridium sp.]|nr:leucine-rich repeat domain-containing protein [Clostridium sp.]
PTINFEPNSKLKTIEPYAFFGNKLTSLTIPASVETIDSGAFNGNQITTINFEPNSKLKTIDSYAFAYNRITNTGLSKLPSSLTSLATDAFKNNPDLTQITLTSPKDLPGWPNVGTVDGKTVIYER